MVKFVIFLLLNILVSDYVGHCFLFAEKDAPVPVYANYKDSVIIKKINIDTCHTLTDVYIEGTFYKNRYQALIIQERDTVSGFIDKKNLINYFDDSPRIKVLYETPSYDSCVKWTIPVEEVPEGYLKVLSVYQNWVLVQSVTKPEIKGWLAPVYSKSTANDPYFISEEKNYKSKHSNRSIKESLNNILDTNYIGCCSLIAEKDKWIPLYASDTDTTVVAHIINDAYREDYPNLHIIWNTKIFAGIKKVVSLHH